MKPKEPERQDWQRTSFHRADGSHLATVLFRGLDRHPEVGPYTYGWSVEFAPDASAAEVEVANRAIGEAIAAGLIAQRLAA